MILARGGSDVSPCRFFDDINYYLCQLMGRHIEKEPSIKDIWIDIIKNLGKMEYINPEIYDRADDELKVLIDKARVSALSDEEYARYEAELKILSDEGTAETYGYDRGLEEGMKKGIKEGIILTAQAMKSNGIDIETISQITKISIAEIKNL